MKFPALVQLYVQLCLLFLGEARQPGCAVLSCAALGIRALNAKTHQHWHPESSHSHSGAAVEKHHWGQAEGHSSAVAWSLSQHGVRLPSAAPPARALLLEYPRALGSPSCSCKATRLRFSLAMPPPCQSWGKWSLYKAPFELFFPHFALFLFILALLLPSVFQAKEHSAASSTRLKPQVAEIAQTHDSPVLRDPSLPLSQEDSSNPPLAVGSFINNSLDCCQMLDH